MKYGKYVILGIAFLINVVTYMKFSIHPLLVVSFGMTIIGIFGFAIVDYYHYALKRSVSKFGASFKQDPEPPVWQDELAKGPATEPTLEEKILSGVKSRLDGRLESLHFTNVRWTTSAQDDEFWTAFQNLVEQGKIVKVAEATETSDSLWTLPKE